MFIRSPPTQTHASYACHRVAQAWLAAKLLAAAADRGHLVALGNFNMLPLSAPHRVITARTPVRDVWRVLHPDSSLGSAHHPAEAARGCPVPSADFNLRRNGATSDGPYNTWCWPRLRLSRRPGRRRPPRPAPRLHLRLTRPRPRRLGRRVGLGRLDRAPPAPRRLPLGPLCRPGHPPPPRAPGPRSPGPDPPLRPPPHDEASLPLAAYDEMLAMTRAYTARERSQRRRRAAHFCAAVVVWAACLVAVCFSPGNRVALLLTLLASLALAAGVVDGLLALLFFSSEIRSLREFEWEVRNARRAAAVAAVPTASTRHRSTSTSPASSALADAGPRRRLRPAQAAP